MAASLEFSYETLAGQLVCEHGSWGSYGVGSRYKATTGEDTADWEDSACCSELQGVWISDSAIVTCSYVLQVFNKSNYQSKPRLQSLHEIVTI
jgi:hypothetical protein